MQQMRKKRTTYPSHGLKSELHLQNSGLSSDLFASSKINNPLPVENPTPSNTFSASKCSNHPYHTTEHVQINSATKFIRNLVPSAAKHVTSADNAPPKSKQCVPSVMASIITLAGQLVAIGVALVCGCVLEKI